MQVETEGGGKNSAISGALDMKIHQDEIGHRHRHKLHFWAEEIISLRNSNDRGISIDTLSHGRGTPTVSGAATASLLAASSQKRVDESS